MNEIMWKVLDELRWVYLQGGKGGGYATLWYLQGVVGVDLAGCGVPGNDAIERLLEMGLIEELPDLHCRYRIVVKETTNETHP